MDGAHSHGSGGGGDGFILAIIVGGIIAGAVIVGPIILAILQAIITILLIVLGTACAGVATFLALGIRSAYRHGNLPWQQRGYGQIPARRAQQALPPPRPNAEGFYVLTEREYRELNDK